MTHSKHTNKPWAGRFLEATDSFVETFTASVGFDKRLYKQDIAGSIAHCAMLHKIGVLTEKEYLQIKQGLQEIEQDIQAGRFEWSVQLEDVHMNIEARLTEKLGEVGKKLHTGRSRNDQVATDMRLYLRDEIDQILTQLKQLLSGLTDSLDRHTEVIMPGFTHLQIAQPASFAHHLLAWFEMLLRDAERLIDARKRVNRLPLGAAALAGTSYPLDRHYTAELLGFDEVCENSLDAVSDRDFAMEFCAAAAILLCHLSRIAEELVLWSSPMFDFVVLPDRFCTGSSIMPQKKNPDVPELVRGKSGRVYGNLMSLLTLMKSQPLAYNKDNQEDKEPLFDSIDTVKDCLRAFSDLLPALQPNVENMRNAALKGYATATDLADYLVGKGLPFRDAHHVVGSAVAEAIQLGCNLEELSLESLNKHSPLIEQDVYQVLTLEGSLQARNHFGATAPVQVKAAIKRAKTRLQALL